MPNIYYDPEKFGLEVFDELDWGGNYEYDKLVVFRDLKTGEFFTAEDSGCSCPSPFESHGRDSLTPLTSLSDFKKYVETYDEKPWGSDRQASEIVDLIERLHKAGVR